MSEREEFEFDFDKDTQVDPSRLHEECFNYARQAWAYGEAAAEAKKEMGKAHEKVKIKRSELILQATKEPEKCGLLPKPTGPQIEAYYRTHKEHIAAKDDFIQKEYRYNILLSGVNSIQFSKATALEGAISLWKGEYFSVEGVPIEVPKEWEAWQKKSRSDATAKQRARMKEKGRGSEKMERST